MAYHTALQHDAGFSMEKMHNTVRRRRLRGLVLHHRRHPSAHPRRLVRRTSHWGDTPARGVCRWCHAHAASIELTWHRYCLDAYLVASGQKPGIQVTMCEGCGGPAAELDHRLAINVARALGPEAMRRAFTIENLGWLCRECHRRKTRLDRRLARFLRACSVVVVTGGVPWPIRCGVLQQLHSLHRLERHYVICGRHSVPSLGLG